ncbi:hypothetical protein Hypma_001968 [Hypsizygus marmoreus]|uniref:Uncharacterized protein n=1 Tax=Hypsizygus marmoreus TaxID=39966 RepID=A0A369JAE8_HYPMA|nr:hypothetical protein Hypma_001968 [Hypsizygus marmoreus]
MNSMASRNSRTDVILPISNQDMQQITYGSMNHDFRKHLLPPSVQRIWFYETSPHSHIAYISEIGPARNAPLPLDGLGNQEFNDQQGFVSSHAYPIRSVYRIRKEPVTLGDLKARYGMKGPPKGLMYVPEKMARDILWSAQERILIRSEQRETVSFGWWVPPPRPKPVVVQVVIPEVRLEEDAMDVDVNMGGTSDVPMSAPMPVSWGGCRPLKRRLSDEDITFDPQQKRLRSY